MSLWGLPKSPKDRASSRVDLPAPFWPTISVVGDLSSLTSMNSSPVDRKFFHLHDLKVMIVIYSFYYICL